MADVTLSTREVDFDLSKLSIRQWRMLCDKEFDQSEEDILVANICGMTVDELLDISQPDYRKLIKAFIKKAAAPLDDPS